MTTTVATEATFVAAHSIIELSARHPLAARALLDPQDMHRLVMSGFHGWVPDGEPDARAQLGVLHTYALDLKTETITLVVQSKLPPDWSRLPKAALLDKPHSITADITLRPGRRLRFRTTINPVRDRVPAGAPTTTPQERRRLPDTTPAHAKRWFGERLQPAGTPPVGPTGVRRIGAHAPEPDYAVRMLPKLRSTGTRNLHITRAEAHGHLTITDPTALAAALTTGIGKGRAYGCGLLLVKEEPTTT
ncbi:type I-E CRISPR-associated protein Cas6/Cse3/CasE [Embleya sp. NPDC050493]|uniref:type I-E CRISPR-associated protein Cas6/Cse3/CasE n=1 Tax=Embleya sp. NPDC050493 TaxID=3363989 RepID=UPI00378E48C3